jgi:hypothetical protein
LAITCPLLVLLDVLRDNASDIPVNPHEGQVRCGGDVLAR